MSDLKKELRIAVAKDNFELTDDGVYFPKQGVLAAGEYFDRVNGGEWNVTKNLIVGEGLAHILNVAMGSTPKPTGYHIALFNGTAAPTSNWTAATFPSMAGEITSQTEGYDASIRPQWSPESAIAQMPMIDNTERLASIMITTASQLTVQGAALLTSSAKGSTSGVLISATKYTSPRIFQNGDIFQIGYRLSLSV